MAIRSLLATGMIFIFCSLLPSQLTASPLTNPEQLSIAATIGSTYDPDPTFSFTQISIVGLYDYDQIMPHRAPDPLRLKLEGSFGFTDHTDRRFLGSFNFFAHYFLEKLETTSFRPYVEAGVGVVYGDFQLDGQGLRVNFNPQAGFGCEYRTKSDNRYYGGVRAYHISNGGLHRDNRGLNGMLLQIGIIF